MKTLTNTLFAATLLAIVFTSSAKTFAAEPIRIETTTSSTPAFNKIWVSGNVKIVLTQGDKESVTGTDNYNAEETSVLSKGQTLYINSMSSSRVTLNITVKDLQRIEACGQSLVVTNSNFDVKYLQLFLTQNATAKIKTTAGSVYTIVKDQAVLKLSGTAEQSTMVASNMRNLKISDFASLRSESYASEAIMNVEKLAKNYAK